MMSKQANDDVVGLLYRWMYPTVNPYSWGIGTWVIGPDLIQMRGAREDGKQSGMCYQLRVRVGSTPVSWRV